VTSSSTLRVAAAQYAVEHSSSRDNLSGKLDRWVAEAAGVGAKLLVFPEFAGMEFASLHDRRSAPDRRSPARHKLGPLPVMLATRRNEPSLEWETSAVQALLPDFIAIHADLAVRHAVYILAGSLPVRHGESGVRNRAYFFSPDGTFGFQDKIVPTRWEREVWGVKSGDQIKTFDTAFGPIGIAICYDVEFPLVARLQAEAGARIILTPCCCDSLRGYHRVRVGARARALENQAYVIQSPTVGDAPWSGVLGTTAGAAGIYGPPDLGPEVDGVIAQGPYDAQQWVYADLDLGAIERIRQGDGVIANESEWDSHLKFHQANKGLFEPATAGLDLAQIKVAANG
jgi:predicted amidohydrolase